MKKYHCQVFSDSKETMCGRKITKKLDIITGIREFWAMWNHKLKCELCVEKFEGRVPFTR